MTLQLALRRRPDQLAVHDVTYFAIAQPPAADVPGAKGAGMPVLWHNRMGLQPVDDARPDFGAASLAPLLDLV